MADSLQKWVGRNRPPRVQITYDVEIGDAIEKKELPFVVGLMSDLSGNPAQPLPKLRDRRFVEIDRDNFNEVMEKISPRLDLKVADVMKGEGDLKIVLDFKEFGDSMKITVSPNTLKFYTDANGEYIQLDFSQNKNVKVETEAAIEMEFSLKYYPICQMQLL